MGKKKPEVKLEEIVTEKVETKLYNSTPKYRFELEYKYDSVFLTISRKNVANFHIGTFKYKDIEELKSDTTIQSYLQLIDIDNFLKTFRY